MSRATMSLLATPLVAVLVTACGAAPTRPVELAAPAAFAVASKAEGSFADALASGVLALEAQDAKEARKALRRAIALAEDVGQIRQIHQAVFDHSRYKHEDWTVLTDAILRGAELIETRAEATWIEGAAGTALATLDLLSPINYTKARSARNRARDFLSRAS